LVVLHIRVAGRRRKVQRIDRPSLNLNVAALTRCLAQISNEVQSAIGQKHIVDDVLPLNVEGARRETKPAIEERILAAQLITPKACRVLGRGLRTEPNGIQIRRALWVDRQGAIRTARAVSLGRRRIDHVVVVDLLSNAEPWGNRVLLLRSRISSEAR